MSTETYNAPGDRVFDEFSPKRMILQLRSVFVYVLSKWRTVLLTALILGAAGATYSYFKKTDYVAEVTFALDEGAAPSQAGRSGLSEITDALGMGGPSYDAGGVFSSPTNIVELMESRLLVEKTLRNTVLVNGHSLSLADFFLDSLGYREKWLKGKKYAGVHLPMEKATPEDSLFENGVFGNIYKVLVAKNLKIERMGKGTTIIDATCITHHELFSKLFLETLMNEVVKYYVDVKTERAKLNLEFIQQRADSILQAYNRSLYGRASYYDEHINPALQIAQVSRDKQQTDVQILKSSYIDLTHSLEAAKTTLIRETPLIQYIDTPILPLDTLHSSMVKFVLIGCLLGIFLAGGYYACKKWWSFMV
jgi:hypothetical protein